VGRVQHVLFDCNSARNLAADTTLLGTDQLAWLEELLTNSSAVAMVWWMPEQWLATASYSWNRYPTERAAVLAMVAAHGWTGRVVIVQGDRHSAGLDTGTCSPGGIPVLMASSLDSTPSAPQSDLFDTGPDIPGRGQYGTVRVDDWGDDLLLTLTVWRDGVPLLWHHVHISPIGEPMSSWPEVDAGDEVTADDLDALRLHEVVQAANLPVTSTGLTLTDIRVLIDGTTHVDLCLRWSSGSSGSPPTEDGIVVDWQFNGVLTSARRHIVTAGSVATSGASGPGNLQQVNLGCLDLVTAVKAGAANTTSSQRSHQERLRIEGQGELILRVGQKESSPTPVTVWGGGSTWATWRRTS
jgi:hypothetical protein